MNPFWSVLSHTATCSDLKTGRGLSDLSAKPQREKSDVSGFEGGQSPRVRLVTVLVPNQPLCDVSGRLPPWSGTVLKMSIKPITNHPQPCTGTPSRTRNVTVRHSRPSTGTGRANGIKDIAQMQGA